MSFFAGTPLDLALGDGGIVSFAVVGLVLEIGIEPTVTHGADLGYVLVVVADARGSVEAEARRRASTAIDDARFSHITDTATIPRLWRKAASRRGAAGG